MKSINLKINIYLLLIYCGFFAVPGFGFAQEIGQDSLDIMIGQMIMVGFHGQEAKNDTILVNDIQKGIIGGVIFYEKNINEKQPWVKLKTLSTTFQNAAPIPLWISIDQEGGRVNRLKPKYGFPPSVSAEYLGELNSPDSTKFYADLTASTLAGLGINVNFAPDVDLATNPDNPIIAGKERSYSADPSTVVKHASIVVQSHRKFDIVTSLKHFPGHGSSADDTHLGMADVSNVWIKEELVPYQQLIESGAVDAIMTAHIINRKLDNEGLPATLSRKVVQDLLRDQMGYDGVIFSDDMHMRAISDHYGTENAIGLCINAGVDVLLFSNNIPDSKQSEAQKIHAIIIELVRQGVVSELRIRESFHRIMKLKTRFLKE
jgi:beta-N-acetylhexosaminidase